MKYHLDQSVPSSPDSLTRHWWVFALRGVLTIIFGILAFYIPGAAVMALTMVFGIFALVDGGLDLVSGINWGRNGRPWGSRVVSGILGIVVGVLVLILPQMAAMGLTAFLWTAIAVLAIAIGSLQIAAAIRLRQEIQGEWLMALGGVISVALGAGALMLFWVSPIISLLSLGVLIGTYAIIHGVTLCMLAFKLKKREKSFSTHDGTTSHPTSA